MTFSDTFKPYGIGFRTCSLIKLLVTSSTLGLLLVACGGGGSGGGDGGGVTEDPSAPAGDSFAVSGTAAKGLIAGGLIQVYQPDDLEQPRYTAPDRTGSDGSYVLTVPVSAEFDGDLLIVEVAAADDGSSTMLCDALPSQGCEVAGETVPFGGEIPLPTGFSLRSVIAAPVDGGSVELHVNPFTQIIYELAIADTLSAESLAAARDQVSSLLGLGAIDPASLAALDISNPDIADSDIAQIKLSVLSGALLQNALRDTEAATINAALETVIQQLVSALMVIQQDPSAITEAGPPIAVLFNDAKRLAIDVGQEEVSAQLLATLTQIELGVLPGGNASVASPGEGLDGLAQAKLFLSDLRNVEAAFRSESLESDLNPLEESLALAEELTADASYDAVDALVDVIEAVHSAAQAYQDNLDLPIYISGSGIEVVISGVDQRNASFSVTDNELIFAGSGVNTVSLQASLENGMGEGTLFVGEYTASGEFILSGGVENSEVSLMVQEGNVLIADLQRDSESDESSVAELMFKLQVALQQKLREGVASPIAFTGQLRGSAVGIEVTELDGGGGLPRDSYLPQDTQFAFDNLDLSLVGSLLSGTDEVAFSASVVQDGADFYYGPRPIGSELKNFLSYQVENAGNRVIWILEDLTTDDAIQSSYIIDLDIETDRVDIELFDADGTLVASAYELPSSLDLQSGEFFDNPSNGLEYANRQARALLGPIAIAGVGVVEPDLGDFPMTGSSGSIDYILTCAGFCYVPNPDPSDPFGGPQLRYIPTPEFPNTRDRTLRGALFVSLVTPMVGIGDETGVEIEVSASKSTVETVGVTAHLRYAGRDFSINSLDLRLEDQDEIDELIISNQDGISLRMQRLADGTLGGSLYRGEEEFATVTEDGELLLFRYTDGSFESI